MSRNVALTQNINVQGRIDKRSSDQIATDTLRKQQIAQRRTG